MHPARSFSEDCVDFGDGERGKISLACGLKKLLVEEEEEGEIEK